ncbi:hypothetical protein GQ457_06G040850 [Hibiscus cannabinus]
MQVMSSILVLGLCFLVLVVEPDGAYGSSRGSLGRNKGAAAPAVDGICAISVTPHGYKCEEHEVQTDDGYILSMQRIPEGRAGGSRGGQKKQPVLIQHGIFAVSSFFTIGLTFQDGITWLMNSPEQNLPMILADNGFDVWIANTRGTQFSRKHVSLDPARPEYWDWSWDELVTYDLPAVFGFVFNHTGQKIHYIGHSLGTLIALTSFSEGHQADQVKSATFLCPIAYLSHLKTELVLLAAKAFVGDVFNCYDLVSEISGTRPILLLVQFESVFDRSNSDSLLVIQVVLMVFKFVSCFFAVVRDGVREGVINKYDYGRDGNLKHYGEAKPAVYNISNIPRDLPIFISHGGIDPLSDVEDVGLLLDLLKLHDVSKLSVQFLKGYAHLDFIMAVNAKDFVYNQIVQFLKNQQ